MNTKEEVLINYLRQHFELFEVKAEFSTNYDKDTDLIVVQETTGEKVVFFGDVEPLFNYFEIQIFGNSIREMKSTANSIGNLIGKHRKINIGDSTYQLIFMQYSNPQAIEYYDIRRVGYTATLKCIINQIS